MIQKIAGRTRPLKHGEKLQLLSAINRVYDAMQFEKDSMDALFDAKLSFTQLLERVVPKVFDCSAFQDFQK